MPATNASAAPGKSMHGEEPNFDFAVTGWHLIFEQYPSLKNPILDLLTEAAGKDAWNKWFDEGMSRSKKQ